MTNDIKYIVVPDVHGRDFYEKDVNFFLENSEYTKIIFLGDYIDPYPKENITPDSALKRFKRDCARSGVLQEVRKREHYEKPSVKRKKKSEAARKRKF